MKNKSLLFLYPLIILVIMVIFLDIIAGGIPPLGKLLNPFTGVVQNEKELVLEGKVDLAGNHLSNIVFDERSVPHVFADSDAEMYFAQGYVMASDRLWQMDFTSYLSAGRMSEIIGPSYLEYDKDQRRLGILKSAKDALKKVEANPETKIALDNYTAGVNAFIEELSPVQYPVEYKILRYEPEKWTNLKSVLVMKFVAQMLSGYEEDASMSQLLLMLGQEDFNKLYPDYDVKYSTEVKDGFYLNMDSLPENDYIDYSFLKLPSVIQPSKHNPQLGSNSWAVSGSKSENGNTILCNDPHLGLSLPSIWYEIQLSSGKSTVYGVTIPGVPGVVIGYNDYISWGMTSGAADVRDWYKLQLKKDYSKYKFDGKWLPTKRHIEKIEVRGEKTVYDTIYYTQHGPIVYDRTFKKLPELVNCALKWALHDPSNEFAAIIGINNSKNYNAFKNALKDYQCPVQNFIYADAKGTIAKHYQGKVNKQWPGQGQFILDGSTSKHLYTKLSSKELPFTVNPQNGYVCSANDNPVADSGPYIGGYFSKLRHLTIERTLSRKEKVSIETMKSMQLDNINPFAELALPYLLSQVSQKDTEVYQLLKKWKGTYDYESKEAELFEKWWSTIEELTWDELRRKNKDIKSPDALVLLNLMIHSPNDPFFDIEMSDKKETSRDVINKAYHQILKIYSGKNADRQLNFDQKEIRHMLRLHAFGVHNLKVGGNKHALNAQSSTWGPSWRMIVEFTPKGPKGIGVYPGGQNGNPGISNYDQFVETWSKGKYYDLRFYKNLEEAARSGKRQLNIR